eukprot:3972884-Amphidinium_carterae.1
MSQNPDAMQFNAEMVPNAMPSLHGGKKSREDAVHSIGQAKKLERRALHERRSGSYFRTTCTTVPTACN